MFEGNRKLELIKIALLFLFYLNNVFAQIITMKGEVVDALTKQPLPGANIILLGTSIGAASDNDGKFFIRDIPPGNYIVKTSYVGYKTNEFNAILEAGRTFETKIKLYPASINGQTVTVTAQAGGQNEAINQQLSSGQIKNVVSQARIQELPDANAAESVARLPGVSIIREGGEGSQVVIRGLSPQYNEITIDGIQLPGNVISNDPNSQSSLIGDRATNLSMISSSMLGGIEVIKAITPDMDAAVLGGVVNFGLRKAVKTVSPIFKVSIQGSHNALKKTTNDYLFVGSYEQRFFDQKLGLFFQGSIEKRDRSSNELDVNYKLNDVTHGDQGVPDLQTLSLKDVYRIREREGITAALDYSHSSGEIDFYNFFSTSNTTPVFRSESIDPAQNLMYYSATDSKNKLNVITNIISIEQIIPIFTINLKLSHTYSENQNPGDLISTFGQDNAGLSGLGSLSRLSPKALVALANPVDSTAVLLTFVSTSNFSKDRAITASIDLQAQYVFSNFLTTKIKFGGMYQYRDRLYDYNYGGASGFVYEQSMFVLSKILKYYPGLQTYHHVLTIKNFIDNTYSFGNFLNGDYSINYPIDVNFMHKIYDLVSTTPLHYNYKNASSVYDYQGTEKKSAAYVMANINLGGTFTILPGIRYQNLTTSYLGHRSEQIPSGYKFTDTTVTRPNGYWLPMIHLIYKPLSWMQLHLAYTHTLNYPDYSAIIPSYQVNYPNSISYNNYKLKPATSENYDIVLSIYNNKIGLFTIDGFKKRIENLIFPSTTYLTDLSEYPELPQNGNQLYKFNTFLNNPKAINIWGLETDWQTHFWYLPEPFSWVVFNINYTHIFSEATYPKTEYNVTYDNFGNAVVNIVDTSYTTRLLNQPNDILNFAIGVDCKGFSSRLSLLYQDNIFKKPDFWMQNRVNSDKYVRWDLSVKQKLPWYGVQLFLNLNNITGEDDTDINQKNGYPVMIERYGMTGDLGLRVSF